MLNPSQCEEANSETIDGSQDLDPAGIFVVFFYIWEKFSKHIKLKSEYSNKNVPFTVKFGSPGTTATHILYV